MIFRKLNTIAELEAQIGKRVSHKSWIGYYDQVNMMSETTMLTSVGHFTLKLARQYEYNIYELNGDMPWYAITTIEEELERL